VTCYPDDARAPVWALERQTQLTLSSARTLASGSLQLTLDTRPGVHERQRAADARVMGARAPQMGARASCPRNQKISKLKQKKILYMKKFYLFTIKRQIIKTNIHKYTQDKFTNKI
jgi:hypothetical protein